MKTFAAALSLAGLAAAHMRLSYPIPFRAVDNKNFVGAPDYNMIAPLSDTDATQFPCKGYHSDFDTPAGASTAEWAAGSAQHITVVGGADHRGGSCQVSLSYDKGATWKVMHSFIGNCPITGGANFPFTVPSSAPAGKAIFAWTWFNTVGNREMYMNCAAVTITGGAASPAAFNSLPDMFLANIPAANGCGTTEGKPVLFPNPGNAVTVNTQDTFDPVGATCGKSAGPPPPVGGDNNVIPPPAATPTTLPGGVFIPAPTAAPAPPKDEAPAKQPEPTKSTLTTVILQPTEAPAAPAPPAQAPAPAPAPPTPAPVSVFPAGVACPAEGQWNCIGGDMFQRCASGQWSVPQALSAGVKCQPGVAAQLTLTKRGIRGASRF